MNQYLAQPQPKLYLGRYPLSTNFFRTTSNRDKPKLQRDLEGALTGKENKGSTPMSIRLERWREKKRHEDEKKSKTSVRRPLAKAPPQHNKTLQNKHIPTTAKKPTHAKSGQTKQAPNVLSQGLTSTAGLVQKTKETAKTATVQPRRGFKIIGSRIAAASQSKSGGAGHQIHDTKKADNDTKNRNVPFRRVSVPTNQSVGKRLSTLAGVDKFLSHQQCAAVKPNLKRRHSDVITSKSRKNEVKKRAPSILKRKSCLPLIPDSTSSSEGEENRTAVSDGVKTPGRNVRFKSPDLTEDKPHAYFRKTPNKKTQESMRGRLDDWLKAKGRTPSKFRHLMCFDAHLSAKKRMDPKRKRSLTVEELSQQQETMERESKVVTNLQEKFSQANSNQSPHKSTGSVSDELSLEDQLESMLEECTTLFDAGCPLQDTLKWLDQIEENIDMASSSAKFYICKARVLQSSGDTDSVLQVFESAVRNNAQPAAELATSLTEIVKEVIEEKERQARKQTALQRQVDEGNIFESSAIKYVVKEVTPFNKRKRRSSGAVTSPSTSCAVVTPVRRSTRRSLADLPEVFHDKTPVYNKLEEISSEERKRTLYLPNTALDLEREDV